MKNQININQINKNLNEFSHQYYNIQLLNAENIENIKTELKKTDKNGYMADINIIKFEDTIYKWCIKKTNFTQAELLKKIIDTIIYSYKKIYNNDKIFNKNLRNVLNEYNNEFKLTN